MEEGPQDHDFDQRLDGPLQRPSVQLGHDGDHPSPSQTDSGTRATFAQQATRTQSLPNAAQPPNAAPSPNAPNSRMAGRHSIQISRNDDDAGMRSPPRASTQLSRNGNRRTSKDFDARRDGPYGRPSLTMTRRQSSGLPTTVEPVADEEKQEGTMEQTPSDPQPPSVETLQSSDAAFEPEPPPLNYDLWCRKWSLIFFWGLILIDCIAMPIALYFGLWYGTDLSPNTVFSIVTAALGGVSIMEYVLRFRRLWKKGSTCRVIGARRMYLDFFHWNFSLGWFIVMIELIVGTIPTHPPIRLLAMPVTSMLYAFGTELLIVDILRYFEVPAPIRISSIPKGSQLRPGIYSIIEDVCAVDGSGGTEYREALNRRYEASHIFRAMLRRVGAFWSIGAQGMAVVTTILIFTIQHEAAYVVGWSAPFLWAGIWIALTYWYVTRMLRFEKKAWAEELAAKTSALAA